MCSLLVPTKIDVPPLNSLLAVLFNTFKTINLSQPIFHIFMALLSKHILHTLFFISTNAQNSPDSFFEKSSDPFETSSDTTSEISSFLYEYYDEFSEKLNTRLPLKLKNGGYRLIYHFLSETELTQVVEHGCWCKFLGTKEEQKNLPDLKIKPVDFLDRICKNWFLANRCLFETENGSCIGKNGTLRSSYSIDLVLTPDIYHPERVEFGCSQNLLKTKELQQNLIQDTNKIQTKSVETWILDKRGNWVVQNVEDSEVTTRRKRAEKIAEENAKIESGFKNCQMDACLINGKFSREIRVFMNERNMLGIVWKPKITFSDSCSYEEDIFEDEKGIGERRHGTRSRFIYEEGEKEVLSQVFFFSFSDIVNFHFFLKPETVSKSVTFVRETRLMLK